MARTKKRKKSKVADDTMNKKPRLADTTAKPPCRLLALPRELREQVYEMCLLVDYDNPDADLIPTDILIDNVRIPGLLQTCQQICAEAFQVWLFGNDCWTLHIDDCYAGHLMKWTQLVEAHIRPGKGDERSGAAKPYLALSGDMRIPHLQQWCQWVHEGRLAPYEDEIGEQQAIADAVELVHKLIMRFKDKPWEECKDIVSTVCLGLEDFGCHFSRFECWWRP